MINYLFLIAAVVIFLSGWSAPPAAAQSPRAVEAEIKFDFYVGKKLYPSGLYRIETTSDASDNILKLSAAAHNDAEKRIVLLVTDSTQAAKREEPKIVFRRIGDKYHLSKIFLAHGRWGFALRQSPRGRAAQIVEVGGKN